MIIVSIISELALMLRYSKIFVVRFSNFFNLKHYESFKEHVSYVRAMMFSLHCSSLKKRRKFGFFEEKEEQIEGYR